MQNEYVDLPRRTRVSDYKKAKHQTGFLDTEIEIKLADPKMCSSTRKLILSQHLSIAFFSL